MSTTWLPAALWAAQRVATARPRAIPVLGVGLGILVLSGHPEASLAMITAAGMYGLADAYSADGWRALRNRDPIHALRLLASAAIGIAMSMVVLLPLVTGIGTTVSHVRAKPYHGILDLHLFTSSATFLASIVLPDHKSTAWLDQRV